MIDKLIYTLFMYSKKRGNTDNFLMAGGSTFFLIYSNLITILLILFSIRRESFVPFFVKNSVIFTIGTILLFFLTELYSRHLVKRIDSSKRTVTLFRIEAVFIYAIISFFSLFVSIALFSK